MNKKILKIIAFILFVIIFVALLWGNGYIFVKNKQVDYSSLDIVGVWTSGGAELILSEDGEFSYYSYEGNSIGDYDLCESYIYQDGKIKPRCLDYTSSNSQTIKVVSVEQDRLVLKIGSKTVYFRRTVDYEEYAFCDWWAREYNGKYERFRIDYDGLIKYIDDDGNDIDESLCEYYTYDDETKTITTVCMGKEADKNETEIKVLHADEEKLTIRYNGELLEFKKESYFNNYEEENF